MTETSTSRDAAIAYLDEEMSQAEEGDGTQELGNILKLFLAEDGVTPQEAAHQIDAFYTDDFLFLQPIFQKQNAKGMINFLAVLDELICSLGRILHYEDTRQDALIQLILELHKLPPRQVKIWEHDYAVYRDDPIFSSQVDEDWNRYSVSDDRRESEGDSCELQESCDTYVNWSSFLARCTSAGILHSDLDYKYSTVDIDSGLEDKVPRGKIRNARILVAANYILLSGRAVRDYCHSAPSESERGKRGRDGWNVWEAKFKDIADGQDEDPEIKDVTRKAHAMMIELDASGHDAAEGTS